MRAANLRRYRFGEQLRVEILNQAGSVSRRGVKDRCDWTNILFYFIDRLARRGGVCDVNTVVTEVNTRRFHPFEVCDDLVVRCWLRKTEDSEACAGIACKSKGAFSRDPTGASRDD